jgi:hypothetical protein
MALAPLVAAALARELDYDDAWIAAELKRFAETGLRYLPPA